MPAGFFASLLFKSRLLELGFFTSELSLGLSLVGFVSDERLFSFSFWLLLVSESLVALLELALLRFIEAWLRLLALFALLEELVSMLSPSRSLLDFLRFILESCCCC